MGEKPFFLSKDGKKNVVPGKGGGEVREGAFRP